MRNVYLWMEINKKLDETDEILLKHNIIGEPDILTKKDEISKLNKYTEFAIKNIILNEHSNYKNVMKKVGHEIPTLLLDLKTHDINSYNLLCDRFNECINFYHIPYKSDIHTYFSNVGTQQHTNIINYFSIENQNQEQAIKILNDAYIIVHRELLYLLNDINPGRKKYRSIIERTRDSLKYSLNMAVDQIFREIPSDDYNTPLKNLNMWLQQTTNIEDSVKQGKKENSNTTDQFVKMVVDKWIKETQNSNDPSTVYFINRLDYIKKNSIKKVCIENLHEEEHHHMIILYNSAKTDYVFIGKNIDGSYTTTGKTFKHKQDAIYYALEYTTQEISVKTPTINEKLRIINRMNINHIPQAEFYVIEDKSDIDYIVKQPMIYKFEFWSDPHGIMLNDTIEIGITTPSGHHKHIMGTVVKVEDNIVMVDQENEYTEFKD